MKASKFLGTAAIIGALAVAALMGVYMPLKLIEMLGEGKVNVVAAGVLIFLSILGGAVVAVFSVMIGVPLLIIESESDEKRLAAEEMKEKLNAYRARQRAMLEELDEVKKLLEEIRNLLREGVGE